MNWIDIVIIVVLGLGVLSGARRGLVKQIIGLVSLVASFLIGYLYMEGTGSWLGAQAGIPAEYATIAGFLAGISGGDAGICHSFPFPGQGCQQYASTGWTEPNCRGGSGAALLWIAA